MSPRQKSKPIDRDELLREFQRYDRDVDIVSIYHWLFTETDLAPTVSHFERYPSIKASDGNKATPDFTVLFNDGSGIIGEIANLALHDTSVEKLCKQLGRYDTISELPSGNNKTLPAEPIDVMFLSPMETASDAVRRIFLERLADSTHSYKPSRKPVVVQFTRNPERYILQLWPDRATTGRLHVGTRDPNYSTYGTVNVQPHRFSSNKVRYAFMNDPVAPLYMATRLWTNVFPTEHPVAIDGEFETNTERIVGALRRQYGFGRADDVRAAMNILSASALAFSIDHSGNRWRVKRRNLRDKNQDVHSMIVDRIGTSSPDKMQSRRTRRAIPNPNQGALF